MEVGGEVALKKRALSLQRWSLYMQGHIHIYILTQLFAQRLLPLPKLNRPKTLHTGRTSMLGTRGRGVVLGLSAIYIFIQGYMIPTFDKSNECM